MKFEKPDFKLESEVPSQAEFMVYFAMQNRVAFPEIFRKIEGTPVTMRYYQIPPACLEDVTFVGGRLQGKTFDLRNFAAQNLVAFPHKMTLFSTLQQIHCYPKMDEIFDILQQDEILSMLLAKNPRRKNPVYEIKSKMYHKLFGIIVGQNKQGDNLLGQHVHFRMIDECQLYPTVGYQKAQQATAESINEIPERLYGVPDNRKDTPFSNAINDETRNVIRTPSYFNPTFTKKKEIAYEKEYKGRTSAEYKSNVLAIESAVSGGAWDWSDISACIKRDSKGELIPAKIFEFDKESVEKCTIDGVFQVASMLRLLPVIDEGEVFVGNDVGQVRDPSIIVPFLKVKENGITKWKMICRVILRNMKYITQSEIIDYLMTTWRVSRWCVDNTNADGKSLIENLNVEKYIGKQYDERVVGMNFREGIPVGIEKDEDGNAKYNSDGTPKYINADSKAVVSNILFTMFRDKEFILANDHQIGIEFTSEVKRKRGEFNYSYFSTRDTHTIDGFRCFAYLMYMCYDVAKLDIQNQKQEFTSTVLDIDF